MSKYLFFHIDKTAGSFFINRIRKFDKKKLIKVNSHNRTNFRPDYNGKFIFFIRDPVERFISAYISRYRQGRPLYYGPWSTLERETFTIFKTPTELAEALTDPDENRRNRAIYAMNNVEKFYRSFEWYLGGLENIKKCERKIYYVGKTETMNDDFKKIMEKLGYKFNKEMLKIDNVSKHETPKEYNNMKTLSDKGKRNIYEFYKKDYEIIEYFINKGFISPNYRTRLTRIV